MTPAPQPFTKALLDERRDALNGLHELDLCRRMLVTIDSLREECELRERAYKIRDANSYDDSCLPLIDKADAIRNAREEK